MCLYVVLLSHCFQDCSYQLGYVMTMNAYLYTLLREFSLLYRQLSLVFSVEICVQPHFYENKFMIEVGAGGG